MCHMKRLSIRVGLRSWLSLTRLSVNDIREDGMTSHRDVCGLKSDEMSMMIRPGE